MKADDIRKIIARHILQEGNLDQFLATPDRSEATQDFLDTLVQEKRRRMLDDLSPLATTEPTEILAAFETFGRYETTGYIQYLAGSQELSDLTPLYMAAHKMGHPEESWAEARAHTECASSIDIKNPQMVIARPHEKSMEEAVKAFKAGTITPEDIPYIPDRSYLNSIQIAHVSAPKDDDYAVKPSTQLFEYVLDQCDQDASLTVEQELRFAGLLALACKFLPGADPFAAMFDSQDAKRTVQEKLVTSRGHIEEVILKLNETLQEDGIEDEPDRQTYLQTWKDKLQRNADVLSGIAERVAQKEAAGSELFTNPESMAVRIYNHDLAHKVATILKAEVPSLGYRTMVKRLNGPAPL